MRELYIPGKTTSQNQTNNDKVSVWTTTQTDISTNENLFWTTKQPSISSGSSLDLTGNVFETTVAPSKDAYNYAKSVWGSVYEDQKRSLWDTLNKLLKLSTIALPWWPVAYWVSKLIENKGKNTKAFWLNVAWWFETNAEETARWLSTLAWKKELAQWIKSVYEKDVEETKWWQALEQEDIFTNIWQRDWEWMWWNVWFQAWNMMPSIFANVLGSLSWVPAVWKIAWWVTLFPSMFQEAYDVYSEDPNITDQEAYVGAIIAWILMSAIEQVWWLEDLTKKGWLKWLAKNIKSPILRFLATYWIETWAEWFEEIFQKIVMDATQWILSGKPWQQINSWDKLLTYIKDLGKVWWEASVTSWIIVWTPTYISLKWEIAQEKREEQINDVLWELAEDSNTYDEFKEWASIFERSEEDLKKIWEEEQLKKKQEQLENSMWLEEEKVAELEKEIEQLSSSLSEKEKAIEEDNMIEEEDSRNMEDLMERVDNLEQQTQKTQQEQQVKTTVREKQTQQFEQIQQSKAQLDMKTEQQRTNEALQRQNEASELLETTNVNVKQQESKTVKEWWTEYKPKIVNWKYVIPSEWKQQKYKWLSREWIEKEYLKDSEEYKEGAKRIQSLTALENLIRRSWYKDTKKIKKAVRDAKLPTLHKNEILNSLNESVERWITRILTLKKAEKRNLWKIKSRLKWHVFNRIYKLMADSKFDTLVWYSDFIIKHRLKDKATEKWAEEMIAKSLYNLSKLLKTDVAQIFEWCKIIFIDYQGKWRQAAWWSMQWFIDWSWTPIIPISLNYIWWKESTVIHELVHWMDFIYQYRNWWVRFEEKFNNTLQWDFDYTLETDFPELLKELRANMNDREKATWYWLRWTEIMSRVFQEYYEYTFLKDSKAKDSLDYSNTLNKPYHWKDINLVERTVNNVVDLFRAEFWLKPLDRNIDNIDDFIRKTKTITDTFKNIWAYDLFEQLSNIWHQLNLKKDELFREQDISKRETIKAEISEIENVWNLLNDWWTEFMDTMFVWYVDKKWDTQLWIKEDLNILNDTISEARDVFISESEWILEWRVETLETDVEAAERLIKKWEEIKENESKREMKKRFSQMIRRWKDLTMKVWSRLYDVDPKIAWSMSMYEWKTLLNTAKYSSQAYSFVEKVSKLAPKDKLVLKKALINYWDWEDTDIVKEKAKLEEIARQLWLEDELILVFDVLEKIWDEFQAAWLKLNRRELYFPREVKYYEWLKEFIDKTILEWGWDIEYKNEVKDITSEIEKIKAKQDITEEDRNRRIRNLLDTLHITAKKAASGAVNQKKRTIKWLEDWWDELMLYYADPEEVIANYIPRMVERIERARFFGRWISAEWIKWIYKKMEELWLIVTDDTKEAIRLYLSWKDEWLQTIADETIKIWLDMDTVLDKLWELKEFMDKTYSEDTKSSITNMVKNSNLTKEKWEELEYVLNSYFGRVWTPMWVTWIKDMSYFLYLWNITSTETQLWDLAFSLAKWWPNNFIKWLIKNILGKAEVTVSDLWIEDLYDDIKNTTNNTPSKILNKTLEHSWFKATDIWMKQVFLQTVLETMRSQAKNRPDYLKARLNILYWEEIWKTLLEAYEKWSIYNEEWELNELMMVDLLYQLSSTQPIMKSSSTVWYNNSWEARLVYTMKTFALNTLDLIIHWTKRTYDVYRYMWKSAAEASTLAWLYTTYCLSTYVIFDLAVQWLKVLTNSLFWFLKRDKDDSLWWDCFLYNWMNYWWSSARKDLEKDVLDALWTLVFINDYSKFAYNTTWIPWVVWQLFSPPLLSYITTVANVLTGKKSLWALTYNIPWVWSIIYYWWWKESELKLWNWWSKPEKL